MNLMQWKIIVIVILGMIVLGASLELSAVNLDFNNPPAQVISLPQDNETNTRVCANFDPDTALREINMTIQKLTLDITQKENRLKEISKEIKTTRDSKLLKEIVELHRDIEVSKSKRAFYQRKAGSTQIYRQYLNGENIGVTSAELNKYKKTMPNFKDVRNPEDAIIKLSIMGEMTFDKIVLIDNKINSILENISSGTAMGDDVISKVFSLMNNQSILWNQLRAYAALRDNLRVRSFLSKNSNSLAISANSDHNCQLKSNGKINCREIQKGYDEDFDCCLSFYRLLPALKSYQTYTFINLRPVAVWVGMYSSEFPNKDYHVGDWCTYTFPPDNKESTIINIYWETAQEISRNWELKVSSVQIKFFYSALVYRQETQRYEETNLIFQYDCYFSKGRVRCLPSSSYGKYLFTNPRTPPYKYTTKIVTNPYWLVCKYGGNCNGYGCQYSKWANAHCGGCFAPDKSASQYFAKS
ncbi:hypothetical protein TK1739 [Thermococcus kodakarensis KOD1]|uniref:Uncharacterized protein n=1 Tax=Thermococcus kodakarensis (strain ATCC BAA-918 / JCM 12380 / KOD1) TaxID=69014 RepID=Q5JJ40_THEKO|nr:hypothetical protein [Thermococcus kodakarensis]WCN27654.1 hypothetical protein POG15_08865 [Thermococcus kodakarensis]BAD85928.1 hypothetical protein TK1739 [Thermococcus kodakarensis KOD1]